MAYTGNTFLMTAPWLALLPEGIWFSTERNVLQFQCAGKSITEVRDAVTKTFGLAEPWKKRYNQGCAWWEYTNTAPNGVHIEIYGDSQGPQSCYKIEEVVEVEEEVPVQFERRKVERKRVRWVCPDGTGVPIDAVKQEEI